MIRSHHIIIPLLYAAVALALSSCESEKMTTVSSQEEQISKWVTNTYADFDVVYYEHCVRVVLQSGAPDILVGSGDHVRAFIEGYIFNNGPGAKFCSDTLDFEAGRGNLVRGLDDGVIGAGRKEVSYVVFSTKYGYYDEIVGVVPAMSPLIFKVEILDIDGK